MLLRSAIGPLRRSLRPLPKWPPRISSVSICTLPSCRKPFIVQPDDIRPNAATPTDFRRHFSSQLPPHIRVTLPALSPTMTAGKIVNWDKQVGDKLNEGDLLAQIETDKATMGFETPDDGYLAKILVDAGTADIPIGQLVCIIVTNETDIAAFAAFVDDASSAPIASASPQVVAAPTAVPAAPSGNYPPHTPVPLPALSPTMSTGSILSWEKKVGDQLSEGDLLAQIETDKASIGFETPDEGYLAKILIEAGVKDIPIGKLICIIVADEKDIAAFANYTADAAASPPNPTVAPVAPKPSAAPAAAAPTIAAASIGNVGRVYASPLARRLADVSQTRLEGKGSGMYGSIKSTDLVAGGAEIPAASTRSPSAATGPGSYTDHPVDGVRLVIGKRLLESKLTIPHFYASIECTMDAVNQMRTAINKQLEKDGQPRLTVNDFVLRACATTNRKVPALNSCWMDTHIRIYDSVDIALAVNSDKGLITPIVWQAERLGLLEISAEVRRLSQKARDGQLQPHEFQGGSFTVSNLGMFGVAQFCAIINPPQTSILAVGGAVTRLVPDAKAKYGLRASSTMRVTLSCDHRAVDGAAAAEWLKHFQQMIEEPHTMLL